jgi:RNA polymerase primary sigma factor
MNQDSTLPTAAAVLQSESLAAYLRVIGQANLLTAEEEVALAKRIESGSRASLRLGAPENGRKPEYDRRLRSRRQDGLRARKQMIEANLRLVVSIAKHYAGRGLALSDLIQEGNIGLMKAVEKFDHSLGYKFSTYATWWIRQTIIRGLVQQGRTIRLPVHVTEMIAKVRRTEISLAQKLGHHPSDVEIADDLGWPAESVTEIRQLASEVVSLEAPVGDEDESRLADFVEDEEAALQPVKHASLNFLRKEIEELLDRLGPRDRDVVRFRFGLSDGEPKTLEEIARRLGITRERVRQIESKALSKLRRNSRGRGLDGLLA